MRQPDETWYRQHKKLRTAGELVAGGGTAGAFMTILYVIIGIAIWSLVGYGLGHLLDIRWLVWVGAAVGAFGGIYLVYIHLTQANK